MVLLPKTKPPEAGSHMLQMPRKLDPRLANKHHQMVNGSCVGSKHFLNHLGVTLPNLLPILTETFCLPLPNHGMMVAGRQCTTWHKFYCRTSDPKPQNGSRLQDIACVVPFLWAVVLVYAHAISCKCNSTALEAIQDLVAVFAIMALSGELMDLVRPSQQEAKSESPRCVCTKCEAC